MTLKRALALSLVLHAAALAVLWVLTGTRAPGPLPLTVRLSAPAPARTVSPPSAPSAPVEGARPAPAPVPEPAVETGAGSEAADPAPGWGEPVIDALTPGPLVEKPFLLGYPSPGYPREARRKGWEGVVELEVEVAADGSWTTARVIRSSGHLILDQAALTALREARYQPATRNGIAESGLLTAVIRFRLN